jgi:hypothetical protein
MPVGIFSSARLLGSKPSSASVGSGVAVAGGGASRAACGSMWYGASTDGSAASFFSHAFLYGVNTENTPPVCDSTSLFSKITWSL